MFNSRTHKAILHLKAITFIFTKSPNLSQTLTLKSHHHHLLKFKFYSTTCHSHSFTVSYLINHCGFSPESALKASRRLRFDNPQKPDSVLSFFTSHGFSISQVRSIVKRELWLLLCDPDKALLPKFQFLRSKGASTSDIVHMVTTGPRFLSRSLENHTIPTYEFVRGFFQSDEQFLACMNRNSCFFSDGRLVLNAKLLLDNGLKRQDIAKLLRTWPSVLCSANLLKTVEELKEMGFNSSSSSFSVALLARRTVRKTKWDEKVETFKRWGWSQEHVLEAFRKQPYCMLSSVDKIDALMRFWVNQLSYNSLDLVKAPILFQLSLQKRIVPRVSVLQLLVSKGLRKKDASMTAPLVVTEELFLEKFVKRFKEHSSHLLKMYEKNMDLASNRENTCLQPSPSV